MRSSPATRSIPACRARSARRGSILGATIREVPSPAWPRRWDPTHASRRLLARELGDGRPGPRGAGRGRGARAVRRRAGPRGGGRRRDRARVRRLRRGGAEVVLRPRRRRVRCGWRPSCAATRRLAPRLRQSAGSQRRSRRARARGRPALRRALAERGGARLLACGRRGAGGVRMAGGVRARADARGAPGARCSPSAAASPCPAGETTLVSFPSPDPEAEARRARRAGRADPQHPGRGCLRASVGAWNDDGDLERLLDWALLTRERYRLRAARGCSRRRGCLGREEARPARAPPSPRRRAAAGGAGRGVIAAAAVLNTVRLSQNGYGNIFYSAGVRSMLRSLAQLLLRRVRPGGSRHDRQAAVGALAPGGRRQAVRLPPAQRAAARGARRSGGGRGPLLGRQQALRRARRSDSRPRVRAVPPSSRSSRDEQRRRRR